MLHILPAAGNSILTIREVDGGHTDAALCSPQFDQFYKKEIKPIYTKGIKVVTLWKINPFPKRLSIYHRKQGMTFGIDEYEMVLLFKF